MNCKYDLQVLRKQDLKATEAVLNINAVEGDNSLPIRTTQWCFKKFSKGCTSLLRKKVMGGLPL